MIEGSVAKAVAESQPRTSLVYPSDTDTLSRHQYPVLKRGGVWLRHLGLVIMGTPDGSIIIKGFMAVTHAHTC